VDESAGVPAPARSDRFRTRLRDWLVRIAERPAAAWVLFGVSVVEASLFPISVDIPLVALGAAAPRKAIRFGVIAAAGSFCGGYLGYLIGFQLFDHVARPLLGFYGLSENLSHLLQLYTRHGTGALVLSGFTPIPYVAFTYTAGFERTLDLQTLTVGALIGRTLRFVPVGIALRLLGPRAAAFFLGRWFYAVLAAVLIIMIALRWAL